MSFCRGRVMVNNTTCVVNLGCKLTKNKTNRQMEVNMSPLSLLKLGYWRMCIFSWASELQNRVFYPPVLDQDMVPLTGTEHRQWSQRRRKSGTPTLSPFLSHALLSDEVLLPGAGMRQWRGAGSVALMGLLYVESNKTRGRWSANRSHFKRVLVRIL